MDLSSKVTFKQIVYVCFFLLLIAAIPVLLWSVKQRAELRKKAATEAPSLGKNPIKWATDYVSLSADAFYIFTNGAYYWGNDPGIQIHSDPPEDNTYTTLEAIWKENQGGTPVEMRMFIYFYSDGKKWWSDEIRTYNGKTPGDWVYYKGRRFFEAPIGTAFTGTLDITSDLSVLNVLSESTSVATDIDLSTPPTNTPAFSNPPTNTPAFRDLPVVTNTPAFRDLPVVTNTPAFSNPPVVTNTPSFSNPPIVTSSPVPLGRIHFTNLRLQPFLTTPKPPIVCWSRVRGTGDNLYWPDSCKGYAPPGQACATVIVPLTQEEKIQYKLWLASDRKELPECSTIPIITIKPTCVPRPPCLDSKPACLLPITENMCPPGTTIGPVPTVKITPLPACYKTCRTNADCNAQSVNAAYSTGLICGPYPCAPGNSVTNTTNTGTNTCITAQVCYNPRCPYEKDCTCGLSPTPTRLPTIRISPYKSPTPTAPRISLIPSPVPSRMISPTPTLPPANRMYSFEFRIKFEGVTGSEAEGAKARIRFVKTNIDLTTNPITFTHAGNGIYRAIVSIPETSLPQGPGYSVTVKGEKHVARKFCKQSGQTAPCTTDGSITLTISPSSLSLTDIGTTGETAGMIFDFTGLTLEPGDINPQDGKADMNDFTAVSALLSKACSELTTQDKIAGDLDYNGCVNARDIMLIRKTLETKYDEN